MPRPGHRKTFSKYILCCHLGSRYLALSGVRDTLSLSLSWGSFPGMVLWRVTGGAGTPSHWGGEAEQVRSVSAGPTPSLVSPLMPSGEGGAEAGRAGLPTPRPPADKYSNQPRALGCQTPNRSNGQAASCQRQSPIGWGLDAEGRGGRWAYASPITWG